MSGVAAGVWPNQCVLCWSMDTWFVLAKLVFSLVWWVVHSSYGPLASPLYKRMWGVWQGAWPQNFRARAYVLSTIAPPLSNCFRRLWYCRKFTAKKGSQNALNWMDTIIFVWLSHTQPPLLMLLRQICSHLGGLKVKNPITTSSTDHSTTCETCLPAGHTFTEETNQSGWAYEQRILDIEYGSFTPLIFSTSEGTEKAATVAYKHLTSITSKGAATQFVDGMGMMPPLNLTPSLCNHVHERSTFKAWICASLGHSMHSISLSMRAMSLM